MAALSKHELGQLGHLDLLALAIESGAADSDQLLFRLGTQSHEQVLDALTRTGPLKRAGGAGRFEVAAVNGADDLACALEVEPCGDGQARIQPVTEDGTVRVSALDIPELTARLYRACGTECPVMLGRPEVDLSEGVHVGPLRAWLTNDGEVGVAVGASQSIAKPHQMRQFAAAAVVLADAAEAPGPDPAEVEKLARVIHAGMHERGCERNPTNEQRAAARIALTWMAKRGAR